MLNSIYIVTFTQKKMLEQKRFSGRHLLTFESQKLNYFGKKSGAGVLTLAHRHLFLVIFFYLDTIYIYSI
jgi:hypothetical protein